MNIGKRAYSFEIFKTSWRKIFAPGNLLLQVKLVSYQWPGAYLGPWKEGGGHKFSKGQKCPPPLFIIESKPLWNYFLVFYNIFYNFYIHFLKNSHTKGRATPPSLNTPLSMIFVSSMWRCCTMCSECKYDIGRFYKFFSLIEPVYRRGHYFVDWLHRGTIEWFMR